jgi:TetR/AcrR family transcriptional regulator, tetracycline repressor protein
MTAVEREPRSSPRKRLTRADVVAAAGVVAKRGVDALTMASVAAELGVTAMALYQHVSDKAHLMSLLLDALLAEVEVPPPSAGDWDVRVRRLHRDVTGAMTRYPGLVGVARELENVGRLLDGYLQIFLDGGFDPATAAKAYTGLYYLAIGAQHPYHGDRGSPAAIAPADAAYEATARAAAGLHGVTPEGLQLFALDVYLDGLRQLAATGSVIFTEGGRVGTIS